MQGSKAEDRYYKHLRERQERGEISGLQRQPTALVRVKVTKFHHPDFRYFDERLGEWVFDEFKGGGLSPGAKAVLEAWQAGDGPHERYRLTRRRRGGYEHDVEIEPRIQDADGSPSDE